MIATKCYGELLCGFEQKGPIRDLCSENISGNRIG